MCYLDMNEWNMNFNWIGIVDGYLPQLNIYIVSFPFSSSKMIPTRTVKNGNTTSSKCFESRREKCYFLRLN